MKTSMLNRVRRYSRWGVLGLASSGLLFSACIKREAAPGTSLDAGAQQTSFDVESAPRTPVLGERGIEEFVLQGDTDKVELTPITVEGQPFTKAYRAIIKEQGSSEWAVQVQAPTSSPVKKGDVMLATFYVRYVKPQESGRAQTEFVFERAGEPYTKSITYPVYLTEEWRKVQVRFKSAEDYPVGGAQMIFRLGYAPQIIEIAIASVDNYGDSVKLLHLPSTEVADLKLRPGPIREPLPEPVQGGAYELVVQPHKEIGKISPYVYGINSQEWKDTGATVRRMGGNRQTAYNWELNASNAGSDWQHVNDDWPCTNLGYKNCDEPGAQFVNFIEQNKKEGMESIVVLPLIDWVSADKSTRSVSEKEAAPSKRFVRSYPKKPGPYSLKPDLKDDAVYQDEFVHFLVNKVGSAKQGGAKFYALDNEPALWPHTHPRVHPDKTTYEEVVRRSEALAVQLTAIDPDAIVLGGVMFGWSEFMSLSAAPDSEKYNQEYGTYIDYFLASMKQLEVKHGRRLMHVLDVHWYPEQRGTSRITENDTSLKTIAARLEAPRSLWDPTYHERTWIGDQWGKPVQLFRWLQQIIDKRYPGTKLALTEYNFGAGDHVSGGLAQADVLGILGREGVYIANYWGNGAGVGKLPKYIAAAFKLYRNYDGKGGTFGDTAVEATPHDIQKASIHAATHEDGRLTIVVINKDLRENVTGKIRIDGDKPYSACTPYVLTSESPDIKALPKVKVSGKVLSHPLPRLSATMFVCEPGW